MSEGEAPTLLTRPTAGRKLPEEKRMKCNWFVNPIIELKIEMTN